MAIQLLKKSTQFTDRFEAGRKLSEKLRKYTTDYPIVLCLPRGGVEVGYEVAKTLGFPINVFVSRKIGAPGNEEYGVGAVSESFTHLNQRVVSTLGIPDEELSKLVNKEEDEVKRRVELYRKGHPLPSLTKRVIILVDDGLATGVTALAAAKGLRLLHPSKIIFAAPVVARDSLRSLKPYVNDIVYLLSEESFGSVSSFYKHFSQVNDKTVVKLLASFEPN